MKRCAIYMRVSTLDQHPETQRADLFQLARQRDYVVVNEYTDKISGTKAKRPGLDQLMRDAHHPTVLRDRSKGLRLTEIAKQHRISRASVSRIIAGARPKGSASVPLQHNENTQSKSAA